MCVEYLTWLLTILHQHFEPKPRVSMTRKGCLSWKANLTVRTLWMVRIG